MSRPLGYQRQESADNVQSALGMKPTTLSSRLKALGIDGRRLR